MPVTTTITTTAITTTIMHTSGSVNTVLQSSKMRVAGTSVRTVDNEPHENKRKTSVDHVNAFKAR